MTAPVFNERLQQLRRAAGLTQEALARRADISLSAVSKLEQGGIDPSWSTVLGLAAALGVKVQAFAEGEPQANPPAPKRTTPPKRPGRRGRK